MAKNYPAIFPRDNSQDPEFQVFEILSTLPDNYSVFYSKRIKGAQRAKEETEIDFVVFDGCRNLTCLEVKGGLLEYRGDEDTWYQNGKPMPRSPDRQATAATHALIEHLGALVAQINVGWALCFPGCSLPQHFSPPSGLPRSIVLDAEGMAGIPNSVKQIEDYYADRYRKPGAPPQAARALIEKLNRSIRFVTKTGIRIARDYKAILDVTDEQYEVLNDLEDNARMTVRGCAGSGKTLLAQQYAKSRAAEGDSVALLFFNRGIANSVRYGIDRNASIECATFHGFARRLIDKEDPNWWSENKGAKDFWDLEVPTRLMSVAVDEAEQFETIIVDEGQDFKYEWYEFLETLLRDKESGRFVVFYDDRQDLFERWTNLPWNSSKKTLTRNCRNTKTIVDFINKRVDVQMHTFSRSPDGLPVVERTVGASTDEQRIVVSEVKSLIKSGVEPGNIVLLLNTPKRESSLAGITKIGRNRLEPVGRTYRPGGSAIQYTTIDSFKGLEADVVMILGYHDGLGASLYTQASRACTLLYLFSSDSSRNN